MSIDEETLEHFALWAARSSRILTMPDGAGRIVTGSNEMWRKVEELTHDYGLTIEQLISQALEIQARKKVEFNHAFNHNVYYVHNNCFAVIKDEVFRKFVQSADEDELERELSRLKAGRVRYGGNPHLGE